MESKRELESQIQQAMDCLKWQGSRAAFVNICVRVMAEATLRERCLTFPPSALPCHRKDIVALRLEFGFQYPQPPEVRYNLVQSILERLGWRWERGQWRKGDLVNGESTAFWEPEEMDKLCKNESATEIIKPRFRLD